MSSLATDRLKRAVAAAVDAHPFIKTRLFLNDDGDVKMRREDPDPSYDEACVEVRQAASMDEVKGSLLH